MSVASTTAATPQSPIDDRASWRALWALCVGFFMILIDSTIVSVATPTLMVDLKTDIGMVLWVTSAYLLAYAVPLLITGRLGDRFGPKRLYLTGLALFTLASAACGFAGTVEHLIAFRVLQGLSASLMTPQTMAVITRIFPAHRRGPAMGLWGAVAGIATLVGPLLGGLIVDSMGWEWIFFVNLPIGVIGFIMALKFVPRLETHPHKFDLLGVALSAIGLFCLIFGIEEGQSYDWGKIWGPISVWGLIIAGLVVLGLFVFWQYKNTREPLVPLGLFKDRNFSAANLATTTMGFVVTSLAFPMMMYTQVIRGLSPTRSALLLLPMAILSGVLAPIVGRILNVTNPRNLAVPGFFLLAAALGTYAILMRPGWSVLWLLIPAAMLGAANSGIWGPLSVSATRNLPLHQAGAGSGVYNTTRQIGSVLGSAAIAVFMQARLATHLPGSGGKTQSMAPTGQKLPEMVATPFTKAMAESMWLPAGVALLGLLAALLLVWVPPKPGDEAAVAVVAE